MIEHKYDDGSVGIEYEMGDIVEITEDVTGLGAGAKVGEYGVIFEIDSYREGDWHIVFFQVDFAGYSRSPNTFFQSTRVPRWNIKPYTGDLK